MEQNIIIHDLDWDWIARWVNLQLIYNIQTGGDKNQKSLNAAMEHFGIEQTRTAHDALGDAYNTALVCAKLDLEAGLEQYEDAARLLAARLPENKCGDDSTHAMEHRAFPGYPERSAAFQDKLLAQPECPECGAGMSATRWVNQGDRRYMTLAACPEHGKFLVRVRFRKGEDDTWTANRIIYRADEAMEEAYKEKAKQGRRRGSKRHRKRRSL